MPKKTKPQTAAKSTLKVYSKFSTDINELRKISMKKGELKLEDLVKSAYVKCYDFIIHSCTDNAESAFFRLPVLRSITEDLIALTFLKSMSEDRINDFISSMTHDELYGSILSQEAFFIKYNPAQIVVSSEFIPTEAKNRLLNKPSNKEKAAKQGYAVLPSVWDMAKSIGEKDLYNYMYDASSRTVHFSPQTLLKMGWGDLDEKGGMINGKLSYKNYHGYYNAFLIFYSSYLFIKQTESFKSVIVIPQKIFDTVESLTKVYSEIDWPELTTFAHLNIKGPNDFMRITHRVLYSAKQSDKKQTAPTERG